jgi:hypothetical protein
MPLVQTLDESAAVVSYSGARNAQASGIPHPDLRESEMWNIQISDQVTAPVIRQTIKRGHGNM